MTQTTTPGFVDLFLPLQGDLVAYLLSMGVLRQDVDDCLQNAAQLMLSRFGEFQSGTNFRAWAFAFVKNQAREQRRTRSRRLPVLTAEAEQHVTQLNESESEVEAVEIRAIRLCIEKLQAKAKELILMRYTQGMTVAEMARTLDQPAASLYTILFRIRKTLMDCTLRFARAGEPT